MSLAILRNKRRDNREKFSQSLGEEEKQAVIAVMEGKTLSGFLGRAGKEFFGGTYVQELERRFREYFGVKHAVSFNSGTTALQGAMAALGIGPGDEVITSPFTMSATATVVLLNNALPVFADVDPETYCIDPVSVEKNITSRTKAILAVNLFGGSADYEKLGAIAQRHGLAVVEDNAQSAGAKFQGAYAGTIGDIGMFSFNRHKIIQAGEGGMLVTNNDQYAFRAQLARNHGEMVLDDMRAEGVYEPVVGSNYRLTELHAVVITEQLKKLDGFNTQRRQGAEYLTKRLKEFSWIIPFEPRNGDVCVYYLYPFRILSDNIGIQRSTFHKIMEAEGFSVAEGYQKPLYLLPVYQNKRMYPHSQYPFISLDYEHRVEYPRGLCPITEHMYEKDLLTTTIFQPPNTQSDIDEFVAVMHAIEDHAEELRTYETQGNI